MQQKGDRKEGGTMTDREMPTDLCNAKADAQANEETRGFRNIFEIKEIRDTKQQHLNLKFDLPTGRFLSNTRILST